LEVNAGLNKQKRGQSNQRGATKDKRKLDDTGKKKTKSWQMDHRE